MIVEFAFGMFTYIIYFEEKIRILTATKLSQVTFRGAERDPLALVAPSRTVRSFVWKVCWDRAGHIINVDIANAKKIWGAPAFSPNMWFPGSTSTVGSLSRKWFQKIHKGTEREQCSD